MLTSDYDLFVFDWDGTLSRSTRIVMLSRFLMKRYSIPTPFGLAGLQEMAKKASKPDQQPAKPKKDES